MRYFLYSVFIYFIFICKASGELLDILDVGLMAQGRPPYFSLPTATEPATGLYIDILDEIGREVGVKFRYRFIPQPRIRHLMNHYRIDVEPGIAEEWRLDSLELKNSIYSHSFLTSSEAIVYNPHHFKTPPSKNTFNTLEPCSILGFSDLDLEKGSQGENNKVLTEMQLLKMIQHQRCDFAVFPEDVIKPKLHAFGLMATKSIAVFDLKLRFTDRHSVLLPKINKAIEKMVTTGLMNEMINKYRGLSD